MTVPDASSQVDRHNVNRRVLGYGKMYKHKNCLSCFVYNIIKIVNNIWIKPIE